MFDFEKELANLPSDPGVYLMRDKNDTIIYVGKAKVLKNRVRQYFRSHTNHSTKVKKMVSNVARFEYMITDSESEALALECNLIKKYKPKYNVLLKDDKHFPYIKVTMGEDWPTLLATRRQENDGAKYFGPYQSMDVIKKNIDILRSIFKIPTCKKTFPRDIGRDRSCLNYQMGKCFAPCLGKVTNEEYRKIYEGVCAFLNGRHHELIHEYEEKMKEAAMKLDFETAASFRDKITAIKMLENRQKAILTGNEDEDAIGLARYGDLCFVLVFFVRSGRVVGRREMRLNDVGEMTDSEILEIFVKQFYDEASYIPKLIMLPHALEDAESIESWLSEKRGSRVKFHLPQKGEKAKMVAMVEKNARLAVEHFKLTKLKQETAKKNVEELAKCIRYEGHLRRIEAYDISHISGTNAVGAMAVLIDGSIKKSEFRRFKLKYVEGADDYASLSEVLYRRFSHEARTEDDHFSDMPDLVLMDGGIGQVHVAKKVMDDLGLSFPVFGMVKDDKHRTRGLVDASGREVELPKTGAAFLMVANLQEEVHKYAISYHQKLRKQEMTQTALDLIPGIGEKRKAALLIQFKSVENIKKASVDELCAVPSMDRRAAVNIYAYFKKEEGGQPI